MLVSIAGWSSRDWDRSRAEGEAGGSSPLRPPTYIWSNQTGEETWTDEAKGHDRSKDNDSEGLRRGLKEEGGSSPLQLPSSIRHRQQAASLTFPFCLFARLPSYQSGQLILQLNDCLYSGSILNLYLGSIWYTVSIAINPNPPPPYKTSLKPPLKPQNLLTAPFLSETYMS